MFYTTALLRWLQRKRYQYEVTFSLYMLTPTEKFIFNSFLFLFLSMVLIAASLYLPEYIVKVLHRARFYYSGGAPAPAPTAFHQPLLDQKGGPAPPTDTATAVMAAIRSAAGGGGGSGGGKSGPGVAAGRGEL